MPPPSTSGDAPPLNRINIKNYVNYLVDRPCGRPDRNAGMTVGVFAGGCRRRYSREPVFVLMCRSVFKVCRDVYSPATRNNGLLEKWAEMTIWTFILNIGSALLLGMGIGLERQWRSHPAGLRTNTLVALGRRRDVRVDVDPHERHEQSHACRVVCRQWVGISGRGRDSSRWPERQRAEHGSHPLVQRRHPEIPSRGASFRLEALAGTVAVLGVHLALRPVVRWIDILEKIGHRRH